MGRRDSASRRYFSDPERFADLVNGVCFAGRQVLKGEDLSEVDPHPGERTRDVVKKASFGMSFAIIGEENQETVDYALPIRIMESDLADYKKETSKIKKRKLWEKDSSVRDLSDGERLYRFPKDGRIAPVVTIVLSNAESWDGPGDLLDMMDLRDVPVELRQYVNGYRMNIVEIPKLTEEDTERFQTDLKQVMDFLRCLQDREQLERLIKENDSYQKLEPEAYELIGEYADMERFGIHESVTERGKGDMRNALDEIYEEGREEVIKAFIEDKVEDGVETNVIRERLIRRIGLDEKTADKFLEKYAFAGQGV